jgi:hypothetical protein
LESAKKQALRVDIALSEFFSHPIFSELAVRLLLIELQAFDPAELAIVLKTIETSH